MYNKLLQKVYEACPHVPKGVPKGVPKVFLNDINLQQIIPMNFELKTAFKTSKNLRNFYEALMSKTCVPNLFHTKKY